MQSTNVSASVREQLQEKLKRLAVQASQKTAPSGTPPTGSPAPSADLDVLNSGTTTQSTPSLPCTSSSVDETENQVLQQTISSTEQPRSERASRPKHEKNSRNARPPVQLSRLVEPLEISGLELSNERTPQTEQNTTQQNTERKTNTNVRRKQSLPEWRASSHVQSSDWRDRSGPSNIEKLNTLDKQLSHALSHSAGETAHHEVVTESEYAFLDDSPVHDFQEQIPDPAKTYTFKLDEFQKRAILHIEQQNCVFVAAHTSAGKTVIAEYAIALAALGGTKVFYTSPIKTLSNQKLRDFRNSFDDVGLVTGDVSINEDAQCVIMTTEILRSMLYRGADVIRDVSYVIFDEVQFLNDEERGVVWEESIIMLPPHIGIIMLSATVPNALEFASWVGKTKEKQVAVVSTNKRPVPLEHALLHPGTSSEELEASLLLEQDGFFLADNFKTAVAALKGTKQDKKRKPRKKRNRSKQTEGDSSEKEDVVKDGTVSDVVGIHDKGDIADANNDKTDAAEPLPASEGLLKKSVKGQNKNKGPATNAAKAATIGEGNGPGQGPNSRRSPWAPLIRFLEDKNQTPTVVFCFSKKGCERAVESLENSDLLPNSEDKARVHKLFEAALMRLREEDRSLPQVKRVFANLKRGISAHHAGLLPIVKEITEILFSEGLVKVLFATETFAMGVNMPARAVVFSGIRKNDGRRFRTLEAGEYTQMSGRAGRRGKDRVGNVYLFFPPGEQVPDEGRMKYIMTGKPISLKSAFRLTYNMILNVLRVDELRVEEVMKRSFSEARGDANQAKIGEVLSLAGDTLNEVNESQVARTARMEDTRGLGAYVNKFSELNKISSALTFRELNPIFREVLAPGRLVIAETESGRLSLSVVFSVIPRYGNYRKENRNGEPGNAVKRETQLWLAYVHSVIDRKAKSHVGSVMFLPESTDRGRLSARNCRGPSVVTSDGLVVVLAKVQAAKIVYIFDETYELSSQEALQQTDAARVYHFSQRSNKIKRWLSYNASYLESIVSKWKTTMHQEDVSFFEAMSSEWSTSKKGSTRTRSRSFSRVASNIPQSYGQRVQLCRDMVTSVPLFSGLVSRPVPRLLAKLEELIIQQKVRNKLAELKTVQETGDQPSLLPEYQNRISVLQKLNYVGSDGLNVQLKGRCGCEVSTADSLVLTEIVCENVLHGLSPSEVASLLSSLVCRKKNATGIHDKDPEKYSEAYCNAKAQMRKIVQNIGKVQEETNVQLEFDIADGGDDYEGSMCRWDLAEAVYQWANGEPFCNITDLTEQQEGDIVVCVKRLNELLKDAQNVAKGVGNVELGSVLEDAVSCIRRDVIFNGSLYYEEELQ